MYAYHNLDLDWISSVLWQFVQDKELAQIKVMFKFEIYGWIIKIGKEKVSKRYNVNRGMDYATETNK